MAEPNETADGSKAAAQESQTESKIESKAESASSELPKVDSPPLSPAEALIEPALDQQLKSAPPPAEPKPAPEVAAVGPSKPRIKPQLKLPRVKIPPLAMSAIKIPQLKLPKPRISRRTRHRVVLAATVMLAAGFGAALGAIANRAPVQAPPQRDAALAQDNHAVQRSVAKLTKDIAALKTSVENTARDSKTQLAKATEKLNDRIDRAVETTGSITKQAAAPAPAAATADAIAQPPIPQPRPTIVQGWTVREARNGRVLVEHRGEYFEVVPGVPLPGLGRVESIRREGNNLVVVTTKGLITETQTAAAIRPRPHYPPPYWRPY